MSILGRWSGGDITSNIDADAILRLRWGVYYATHGAHSP